MHSGSAQDRIARLKTRIAGLKTAGELSPSPRRRTAKPASALKTPVRCKTRPESPGAARGHRAPLSEVGYRPRKPENSIIHRVIAENLSSFLDQAEQASNGQHFPAFVIDELKGLVSCGDYRQGFALFRCGECNTALALPFSCKSRVCPSCAAKRMTSLSAHLTDNVIPFVPVRQWVLSFPVWLRYKIGYDHDLYREVIGLFDRHVCSFYRQQAEQVGIRTPYTGSVHAKHLAGGAGNLNPHDHSVYLDGFFYQHDQAQGPALRFRPAEPPTDHDIGFIVSKLRSDVLYLFRDRGLLDQAADEFAEQQPLLAACTQASLQNLSPLGPRAGKPVIRLGADPMAKSSYAEVRGRLHVHYDGFDLHAQQRIHGNDRRQLERTLRYCLRGPLSEQRLSILDDGKVQVAVKKIWSDGTRALLLTPHEFLARVAALIPRPHKNLVIYRGILAPNHKLRRIAVEYGRKPPSTSASAGTETNPSLDPLALLARHDPQDQLDRLENRPGQLWLAGHGPGDVFSLSSGSDAEDDEQPPGRRNYTWAELMKRAHEIDVLQCPRSSCRGRLKFIACITEPAKIDAILRSLGKPGLTLSPPISPGPIPPRAPPPPPRSRYGPLFDAVI